MKVVLEFELSGDLGHLPDDKLAALCINLYGKGEACKLVSVSHSISYNLSEKK